MRDDGVPVWGVRELASVLTADDVIQAVKTALVDLWRGEIRCPPPSQLTFDDPSGDCHIKSAQARNGAHFSVKVATGFYDNPRRGLPVNNGIVLLFDARTGIPSAIFQDHGWITSWRTAAAGALAAQTVARRGCRLGIVGTGHQAFLQALWISRLLQAQSVAIVGRSVEAVDRLAERLAEHQVIAANGQNLGSLVESCDVIVLCTSAQEALLHGSDLRPGLSVISLGADGHGKSELAASVFSAVDRIAVDDHAQCLANGDYGRAVKVAPGLVKPVSMLGELWAHDDPLRRQDSDSVVITLTGSGAQDLALAQLAFRRLVDAPSPVLAHEHGYATLTR